MNASSKSKDSPAISVNRKAHHDYAIEDTYETGMVLMGWEVKSLRDGRVQLADSYVVIKEGVAMLLGSHITPLPTASTHVQADPTRTRKLLLHHYQIRKLSAAVERQGYALIPLKLYWNKNHVKLLVGLAKGKKLHDKRASLKEKDWQREKQRLIKTNIKG